MDLQTLIAQAMAKPQQNRNRMLQDMAANDQIALDDPRMAGVNPGLDSILASANKPNPYANRQVVPEEVLDTWPPSTPPPLPQGFDLSGVDLGSILNSVGNVAAAIPNGPMDLAQMLASYASNNMQPAPQAPAPVQDNITPQRPMMEAPPAGAPVGQAASPQDIVSALQGQDQTALPSSLESALGGDSAPAELGFFDKLKGFLGDPAISRMLLQAGASMDNGGTLAMGLNDGMKVYDSVKQTQADAPYKAQKRQLELKKTSSDIANVISQAGKNLADGDKTRKEAGMVSYNAETDRIKANAAAAQAKAAMAGIEVESKKLLKSLEKTGVIDDKSYSTLYAKTLDSVNNNPMLTDELTARGLDTAEYTSWVLNNGMSEENRRHLPLKSGLAENMVNEYRSLTAAEDTPESKEAITKWRSRMEDYKSIYGRDALVPIIQKAQGK